MLVSEGRELDRAVAAVMYHARNLMRQQSTAIEAEQPADLDTEDDVIGPMWLEHWYDGLGYCTLPTMTTLEGKEARLTMARLQARGIVLVKISPKRS
jgi:hypothetical protein